MSRTQGKQLQKRGCLRLFTGCFPFVPIPASTGGLLVTEEMPVLDLANQYAALMLWTNNCSRAHTHLKLILRLC